MKKNYLIAAIFTCLITSVQAKLPVLKLSEVGEGLDHAVMIEADGLFKLGFDNGLNYGLTQWYDLSNPKQKNVDISQNHTDYIPVHEQGALFNQCTNPGDLIGHVIAAKETFPNVPRSITIIESSPLRVIVENKYHPMLGSSKDTDLFFNDTYTIYPSGRIYITHRMGTTKDLKLTEWRNAILGLGDPSFNSKSEKGSGVRLSDTALKDESKNWKENEWVGYRLNLPGWKYFTVVKNDATTLYIDKPAGSKQLADGEYKLDSSPLVYGWIRNDSLSAPIGWHKGVAEYLYCYWDPKTPEPYTDWTKTSVMMVRFPNNPHEGGGGRKHGWRGYKRTFWGGKGVELKKGQIITQYYMIHLGSSSNDTLPHFSDQKTSSHYANQYSKKTTTGSFDQGTGTYALQNELEITADLNDPVFSLSKKPSKGLTLNGADLAVEKEYRIAPAADGTFVVQYIGILPKGSVIAIKK